MENISYVIINQQKNLQKRFIGHFLLKLTVFAQKPFLRKITKKYLLNLISKKIF